jgi:dienelactone hydrolase
MCVVAGCGGGDAVTATPTPTAAAGPPRPVDACGHGGPSWAALETTGDSNPYAAVAGRGTVGVVFANDSNNDACSWNREARALVDRGYAVAVFDSPSASYEVDQALAVAAALRHTAHVKRIVVIGASVGARAALQIAAEHPREAAGIVALSAERRINGGGDLLATGRKIDVPVLNVGSAHDPLTSFGMDTTTWDRTIPPVRTLSLSGSDHGVDFLHDRHRPRVQAAIARFVAGLD